MDRIELLKLKAEHLRLESMKMDKQLQIEERMVDIERIREHIGQMDKRQADIMELLNRK